MYLDQAFSCLNGCIKAVCWNGGYLGIWKAKIIWQTSPRLAHFQIQGGNTRETATLSIVSKPWLYQRPRYKCFRLSTSFVAQILPSRCQSSMRCSCYIYTHGIYYHGYVVCSWNNVTFCFFQIDTQHWTYSLSQSVIPRKPKVCVTSLRIPIRIALPVSPNDDRRDHQHAISNTGSLLLDCQLAVCSWKASLAA